MGSRFESTSVQAISRLVTRNSELIAMGQREVMRLLPGIVAGLRNPGVRPKREVKESR